MWTMVAAPQAGYSDKFSRVKLADPIVDENTAFIVPFEISYQPVDTGWSS